MHVLILTNKNTFQICVRSHFYAVFEAYKGTIFSIFTLMSASFRRYRITPSLFIIPVTSLPENEHFHLPNNTWFRHRYFHTVNFTVHFCWLAIYFVFLEIYGRKYCLFSGLKVFWRPRSTARSRYGQHTITAVAQMQAEWNMDIFSPVEGNGNSQLDAYLGTR